MRERVRHTGLNVPHKRNVMFGALFTCVWLQGAFDAQWDGIWHLCSQWHGIGFGDSLCFSRLVYLLRSLFSVCVCPTRHGKCHKAKPKDLHPALCEISLLSWEPALWTPPPLSGSPPNVVLVLVSVLIALCAGSFLLTSFSSLYFTLPCPILSLFSIPKFLSFHITSTRSHLWNLTQFLMPGFFFPAPIRGHANLQRQTTLRIQKYPICSSNMLIFFLCCSRNGNRMFSKADFKSASLCLLRNTSLGDKSSFALC